VRKLSFIALASIALAGCQSDSSLAPEAQAPAAPKVALDNSYIVVMRSGATKAGLSSMQTVVDSGGGNVEQTYSTVFRGFAAHMSASAAADLRNRPDVALVEPDAIVHVVGTQTPAPWDLDRLDQSSLPLDNAYTTTTAGDGVSAYIIDTGIRASHNEFGGRAVAAFSAIGGTADDCNGHGTHVAGTIGGATWGVAKHVKLYGIRVMDCSGNGRVSSVLAGIDWVTTHANKPAVVNMSIGGGISASLDAAVQNSIASGITYTIAAGNSSADACNESPGRVPTAITVGAMNSGDARASFSNFGSCVDLFAPGVDVTSAWIGDDNQAISLSGTSMASPHAAGVAALYLESHPSALPAEVSAALTAAAGVNKLQDVAGSPNLLLSTVRTGVVVPPAPVDQPPVARFNASCALLTCALDASSSTDDGRIVTYNWSMPGAVVSASIGVTAAPTYITPGVKSITLTVTDNAGQSASTTQTVAVAAPNQAPVAAFSYSCSYLACSFDASASTDDAGIASYGWTITGGPVNNALTGATTTFNFPGTGTYSVVLTVRDGAGLTGTQTRSITVTAANQSPSVSISAPTNDASVVQGASINFVGAGNDAEDGTLGGASLTWASNINGVIGTGNSFWTSALSVGNHTITLTAKDSQGATTMTTRLLHITAPNQAPTVGISSPANGTTVTVGTSVTFTGTGADAEDGALSGASLSWASNINGPFGTGATVTTNGLSIGTHVITLTAKDSQGATTATTRTLIVNAAVNHAPSANITAPTGSPTVVQGTPVTFVGNGIDPEDGPLSGAALKWESNRDGLIGTGTTVTTSGLSIGSHTVVFTATDSKGLSTTSYTYVTVVAPEPVVVVPPAPLPPAPLPPAPVVPTANFSVFCPASSGITHVCRFDASASTDAQGIVTYAWNFGDGRSSTELVPTRILVYPRKGTYDVTLTVTNRAGNTATTVQRVSVR
jgi:PKD repeat protein